MYETMSCIRDTIVSGRVISIDDPKNRYTKMNNHRLFILVEKCERGLLR